MSINLSSAGAEEATVRFTLPAHVALDPNGFSMAIENIAERIGCTRCFSGVNCLFERVKDYVVREDYKIPSGDRDVISSRSWPTVDVVASSKQLSDIKSVQRIAEIAFGKLGCLPCTSGFDVRFKDTLRTLVIDESFEDIKYGRDF